jgi:hypothetical protein
MLLLSLALLANRGEPLKEPFKYSFGPLPGTTSDPGQVEAQTVASSSLPEWNPTTEPDVSVYNTTVKSNQPGFLSEFEPEQLYSDNEISPIFNPDIITNSLPTDLTQKADPNFFISAMEPNPDPEIKPVNSFISLPANSTSVDKGTLMDKETLFNYALGLLLLSALSVCILISILACIKLIKLCRKNPTRNEILTES